MANEIPHHYGHRRRIRERFVKAGLEGMADYEVVKLLLTLAIPRSDVKKPAKDFIAQFGKSWISSATARRKPTRWT